MLFRISKLGRHRILELAEQLDTPDVAADSPVEDISSDVETYEVVLVPAPSVNSRPLVILDYHVIPTPVVEAVKWLENTGVAIRCLSYVGTAYRTWEAWVSGPLSHIPLECVCRKSWRSARRRDGHSDKTKAQRVLELGATALCDDTRDILDELQERWHRLLDPRQAPWTTQVKSANSASTSIQLLVERIRAAKTLQSAGERCNLWLSIAHRSDE